MTQNATKTSFALSGVIGIIDKSISQFDIALEMGLRCVEIRADLLHSAGLSNQDVIGLIARIKSAGLACLYTLRHTDQGGTFNDDEQLRVSHCSQALDAGADVIDLEHGTVASMHMLQKSAPMILSYHNFIGMLDQPELAQLTAAMEQQSPAAVKIIPTGKDLADAAAMMDWVSGACGQILRIGFTMGEVGAVSRILALSVGSPITYASFGKPVAPGQVDMTQLLDQYNCQQMNRHTKVIALCGSRNQIDQFISEHRHALAKKNSVCIGFSDSSVAVLKQYQQSMNLSEIVMLPSSAQA